MKQFATYFDYTFIPYAAMCLASFFDRCSFDSLTLILPTRDGTAESKVLDDVATGYMRRDPRVKMLHVDEIRSFPERQNDGLCVNHPQLFTDILRSSLVDELGAPVLWFDTDMLFLDDISDCFGRTADKNLAAAPDMVSRGDESTGARAYALFVDHVAQMGDSIEFGPMPINCGLLLLSSNLQEHFHKGLNHAITLLEHHQTAADLPEDVLSTMRHTLGQLAWNYVFHATDAQLLPTEYNCYPDNLGIGPDTREASDPRARVLHYVGLVKRWRMAVDYTRLYGRRIDQPGSAPAASQE